MEAPGLAYALAKLAQSQGMNGNEHKHTYPKRNQHQRLVKHLSRQVVRFFVIGSTAGGARLRSTGGELLKVI